MLARHSISIPAHADFFINAQVLVTALKGLKMRALHFVSLISLFLMPGIASAEMQISIYGGANTVSDSDLTLDIGAVSTDFDVEWEGKSFEAPPYYGLRGTYWLDGFANSRFGVAVDFTHAKAYADIEGALAGSFSDLEFTHGLNLLTLNGLYRAPLNDRFYLYAGAGAGITVPHVQVATLAPADRVSEYQLTGPTIQGLAGANVRLGRGFSLFGEYKASYSWSDVDLGAGNSLDTSHLVHHFALGLSFSFGGAQ